MGEIVESIGTGRSSFVSSVKKSSDSPFAVLGSTSVISYDSKYDHDGDFILTARVGANAGNLYRYSGKAKISDNTVFIQGSNLDIIFYLLEKFNLKSLSFGTGQPLIKSSELKSLTLKYPQKEEEQSTIGNFFRFLDDTIALYKRKLHRLRELKKGYLQQMFPQSGERVPRVRFAGFSEPWEQRKLGNVSTKVSEKIKIINSTKHLLIPQNTA